MMEKGQLSKGSTEHTFMESIMASMAVPSDRCAVSDNIQFYCFVSLPNTNKHSRHSYRTTHPAQSEEESVPVGIEMVQKNGHPPA